jgi:hypothetical protein
MNDGAIGTHQAWLTGIGEEPDRLSSANQDEMADITERSNGIVHGVRQELNRPASTPALDQAVEGRRDKPGVGQRCDAMSVRERIRLKRSTGHH